MNLPPAHFKMVKSILKKHIADVEVWAFGSRVGGSPKKYSDLDLAVIHDGSLSIQKFAMLEMAFSESDLPIKVDILDWATTTENFKNIISKNHEVIQSAAKRGINRLRS